MGGLQKMKKSKNNFVIYTALFGDYDELKHPLTENTCNYDFVCFTNQKDIKSDIWQIRFVEEANYLPNIANRKYKMLPHLFLKDYEESIYIDANVIPKGNIAKFREEYLEPNFSKYDKIIVDLDDLYGCPSSFREEAFGGLARIHSESEVMKKLTFICTDEPPLVDDIHNDILDANKQAN